MRTPKPQPPQEFLRDFFGYDDDATRQVNGFGMRGGLVRKVAPIRTVCGSRVAGEAPSRAEIGVRGWGVHYRHRIIWIWHHGPIPDDLVVDHIDGDPSNNRSENLRLLTDAENQMNRQSARADSTIPYIGVCRNRYGFNAFASDSGAPVWLGFFEDAIAAALTRDRIAERKAPGIATLNRDLFPEVRARFQPQTKI